MVVALVGVSFAIFVLGFLIALFPPLTNFGVTLIFLGPLFFTVVLGLSIAQRRTFTKRITLDYLASHPDLILGTNDPGQLPLLERNLTARLADLKDFLAQTHGLVTKRIIEL